MARETNQVDISNAERAQLANKIKADLSLRLHKIVKSMKRIKKQKKASEYK